MLFWKQKKKGFTLAEVIIICTLFSMMVIGIIVAINGAFIYMNNTRLATRASNLVRGGVEMVYNLRDSNRRIQSGERDKYWLNTGKRGSSGLDSPGNMLTKGYYIIKEGTTTDGDHYVYAESLPLSVGDDFYDIEGFFSDSYSSERAQAELKAEGSYLYFSGSQLETGNLAELLDYSNVKFYRILRVYGIYKKNVTSSSEEITSTSGLQNSDPKELRFCVKVFYESEGQHASELCSIMTNFME